MWFIPENILSYALQSEHIAIFKTIAIDESKKGLGIGTKLVHTLLKSFKRRNLTTIACVAWQYGETENIRPIMQKFSFICYEKI